MPKNTTPYMLKEDAVPLITLFEPSDTTNWKDVAIADTEGSYLYELLIRSTDTVARNISFRLVTPSSNYIIYFGRLIPANTGNNSSTPSPIRMINGDSLFLPNRLLDRDQNFYIPLAVGCKIQARMEVTVTTATQISVVSTIKNF
jgi:hypothetical protein